MCTLESGGLHGGLLLSRDGWDNPRNKGLKIQTPFYRAVKSTTQHLLRTIEGGRVLRSFLQTFNRREITHLDFLGSGDNLDDGQITYLGPYPQYSWDFPEEIPERPRKRSQSFSGIPLQSTAGIPPNPIIQGP